jgi:hypothetical protein
VPVAPVPVTATESPANTVPAVPPAAVIQAPLIDNPGGSKQP